MDKPIVSRTIGTNNRSSRNGTKIDHIVLHYTTSRNIEGSITHFRSGTPRVSAHYIIGQDGELVQMVDDADAAWHATTLNPRSIGIEHVAKVGDKITPKQERTSALLIKWLCETYSIPQYNIVPHNHVKPTSCPGDLFADYGGKAGADRNVQNEAVQKWLTERVFVETLPELPEVTNEVSMSDETTNIGPYEPIVPVTVAQPKPAAQSLTVWGSMWMILATTIPAISAIFGVSIPPDAIAAIGGGVAAIQTIVGRVGAKQPLKLK